MPTCAHPRAWTDFCYVPRTKTKTLGPQGFYYIRLVCRVGLAPGGLAWSRTLARLLQNKTEILLFHSWLIFFRFSFMYFIILFSFVSSPCAPTWCSLAGAYKCLNWIELNCWAKPSTVVGGFVNNADSRRDAWNFSRSILLMRLEATGTAGTIDITLIFVIHS